MLSKLTNLYIQMSTFKNRNWTGGRGGGGGRGSSGGGRGGGGYRSKWGSQSQRSGIYIGTRGFFITVEGLGKERGAIREAQNLYDSIIASLPSTTLPLPSTNEKRDEPADVEQQAESLDAADELTAACSAEKASANESNIVGGGGAQGDGGSHVSTRIWQVCSMFELCLFVFECNRLFFRWIRVLKIVSSSHLRCPSISFMRFLKRSSIVAKRAHNAAT